LFVFFCFFLTFCLFTFSNFLTVWNEAREM